MTEKMDLGRVGEDFVEAHLKTSGYVVIERNYLKPWGELDIVAIAPDKALVFVEVKTMKGSFGGLRPEDQMTASKVRKFRRTAQLYAGQHPELVDDSVGWRLDLVAVAIGGVTTIRHYENI